MASLDRQGAAALREPRRSGGGPTRRERASERIHAALLRAARQFIREGRPNAAILEITQAADVGLGSFYNHFESREALFHAAVDEALETVGQLLDRLGADRADPADRFAQSFRLMGRLNRTEPELTQVLLSTWTGVLHAERGLVPRARRDVEAGIRTGRFTVEDPALALALTVAAWLTLTELLLTQPERDAAADTDAMAVAILRMLGLDSGEAERICSRPLPDVTSDLGHAMTGSGAHA